MDLQKFIQERVQSSSDQIGTRLLGILYIGTYITIAIYVVSEYSLGRVGIEADIMVSWKVRN
jgi:hypothetical protein